MNDGGAVHLACAAVAALLADAPAAADWLSPSEQQRFGAMRSQPRRDQFLAARWQARTLLAAVLGGAARDWPLSAPADAPPRVERDASLVLSVSHSGGWAACAVARVPLGLDLEAPQRPRDIDGLVGLCCTPAEQALFDGLDLARRSALFYELWTVKEAWLKRRRDWIAPQRLRELDTRPAAAGAVRTWAGEPWRLALCSDAGAVRWWTPEPAARRAWSVCDAATAA